MPAVPSPGFQTIVVSNPSSQVSATLDLPGQLYNDNLVESNSLLGTYVPLPDALTGPVPGTAKEIHLVRQASARKV